MFNLVRRAKLVYTQLEVSKQIADISELMDQRKEATKPERAELDTQIEMAQYVLSHMLGKNKKRMREDN